MKKHKNAIIMFLFISILGIIGFTLAYFNTQYTYENTFTSEPYSTQIQDDFVSPTSWVPGTVTPKTVIAKNTGNIDVAVRISLAEKWVSRNGNTLSLTLANGQRASIINFINESDWTYKNGYYYYNDTLSTNESTSSFIESVTFNENAVNDYSCQTVNGITNCTSTGDGYDGATSTLTITIETIQADAKDTVW